MLWAILKAAPTGGRKVDDVFYSELRAVFDDAALVELFLTAAAFEMFLASSTDCAFL